MNCKTCEHYKEHSKSTEDLARVLAVCRLMNITLFFYKDGQELIRPTRLDASEADVKTPYDCPKRQIERSQGREPSVTTIG